MMSDKKCDAIAVAIKKSIENVDGTMKDDGSINLAVVFTIIEFLFNHIAEDVGLKMNELVTLFFVGSMIVNDDDEENNI